MADLTAHLVGCHRVAQVAAMPDEVIVERPGDGRDPGMGSRTRAMTTVTTTVGRLTTPTTGDETLIAGKATGRTRWVVVLPWDTDVRGGDELVVAGRRVEVIVAPPVGGFTTAVRAICAEVA